jgi:UDP-GlcNAc:undecaprenyl-phosphate GlcNAc-1-phosphate transferase
MTPVLFTVQTILLALVISLLLSWFSAHLARRLGLIDWPRSAAHKTHNTPTPLAGGIALVSSLAVCSLLLGIFTEPAVRNILLTGLLIFGFGVLDDLLNIPAWLKLSGQILAAIGLVLLGVSVGIFTSPEFIVQFPAPWSGYLNFLVTIFWLVGMTNAFNFVDSMDGLMVGVGLMATMFFCIMALVAGQVTLAITFGVLFGVSAGIYFYNSPPALFFMGDSGSQTFGFILAALAIYYQPVEANQSSSWIAPILLLGVPIFDTTLVVLSRLRRRRPIYRSALDHTYHRLIKAGFKANRAVLTMQGASLVLGLLALACIYLPPLQANLIFSATILSGLGSVFWLDRRSFWP